MLKRFNYKQLIGGRWKEEEEVARNQFVFFHKIKKRKSRERVKKNGSLNFYYFFP